MCKWLLALNYTYINLVSNQKSTIAVFVNFVDQNTACLTEHVIWNCPDGHIIVNKAVWETNGTCGVGFTIYNSLNVIKTMKTACENRQNCTFIANDHNFQVSCATSASRCTFFDYVYTCISKSLISYENTGMSIQNSPLFTLGLQITSSKHLGANCMWSLYFNF